MRHSKLKLMLTGLAGLALASCANSDAQTQVIPTALPATSIVEATALPPTAEPTAVVDYCLDCHTDQEQLTNTADPVVEMEGESKGVG